MGTYYQRLVKREQFRKKVSVEMSPDSLYRAMEYMEHADFSGERREVCMVVSQPMRNSDNFKLMIGELSRYDLRRKKQIKYRLHWK